MILIQLIDYWNPDRRIANVSISIIIIFINIDEKIITLLTIIYVHAHHVFDHWLHAKIYNLRLFLYIRWYFWWCSFDFYWCFKFYHLLFHLDVMNYMKLQNENSFYMRVKIILKSKADASHWHVLVIIYDFFFNV